MGRAAPPWYVFALSLLGLLLVVVAIVGVGLPSALPQRPAVPTYEPPPAPTGSTSVTSQTSAPVVYATGTSAMSRPVSTTTVTTTTPEPVSPPVSNTTAPSPTTTTIQYVTTIYGEPTRSPCCDGGGGGHHR
ncbi:hypothetical protein [Kutzneria sp. NPDC052558]|uniref:hypothetical protein n=1 Tax=Kutzneria sp. NPDC052558 TaxID=3364121 RepID=UPI0037CB1EE1